MQHSANFSSAVTGRESTLSEWVSDTAPLSVQYVNKNHVLSDNSLYAVSSRIVNESQRERDSQFSRQFHSRLACSRLSSTELRKEQISSWRNFVHFVHSKDLFVWTTRSYNRHKANVTAMFSKKLWRTLFMSGFGRAGASGPSPQEMGRVG